METDSSLDNMGDMNWKLAGIVSLSKRLCKAEDLIKHWDRHNSRGSGRLYSFILCG